MPAYHSAFNAPGGRMAGNMGIIPIKSKIRGPAPPAPEDQEDVIDEAIDFFRANCLFRNFEIKGPGDRTLIYLTLFIQECLQKAAKTATLADGQRQLMTLAVSNFPIPGDAGFPLNTMFEKPANRADADLLRAYLTQCRQELVTRFTQRLYEQDKPSKWWMSFSKRKFMNIASVGTTM